MEQPPSEMKPLLPRKSVKDLTKMFSDRADAKEPAPSSADAMDPRPVPAATAAAAAATWVEHHDEGSGKPYYENTATGKTQWEQPAEWRPHAHASYVDNVAVEWRDASAEHDSCNSRYTRVHNGARRATTPRQESSPASTPHVDRLH
jgi:hypothetical protein